MSDGGTLLSAERIDGSRARDGTKGRENSVQGGDGSLNKTSATMFRYSTHRCKRCGTDRPHSLTGLWARAETHESSILTGSARIAGRQRGGIGPQLAISDRMSGERGCKGRFSLGLVDKAAPAPHSLKGGRLTGFWGGAA